MQLSLRDAHRVIARIGLAIKEITPEASLDINPWNVTIRSVDYLQQTMDEHLVAYNNKVSSLELLHKTRYQVRELIGQANAVHLDQTISEHRYVSDRLKRLTSYMSELSCRAGHLTSATAVLNRLTQTDANSYSPNFEVFVVPVEQIEKAKADVRATTRELEVLQDKLTVLNASTKITLSDELVDVLNTYGLIA